MSLKLQVKFFCNMFFTGSLATLNRNNKNSLCKSSLHIYILVEEFCKFYRNFLRVSGFPDLFDQDFLIKFKFS